jgi:hypothetical protein
MKFAVAVCGWGSIIAGFVAAVYWIWSACVGLPVAPDAVFIQTSPNDPFNVALRRSPTSCDGIECLCRGLDRRVSAAGRCRACDSHR